MSDGIELLHLGQDFPPVATADWEALIQKDLKGADYEKKLVWRSEEGIAVRPYYRSEQIAVLGDMAKLAPGEFPFTRGTGQAWEETQHWTAPPNAVRGDSVQEAGGTAVQELGFALAEAVEKLERAIQDGKTVETAAPGMVFVFAVGSNYFFEIAKLRAARTLWSAAVAAFGCEDPQAAIARIHVRTSRINKSVLDSATNLLRVTTEAMSAVLGGCDSLTIDAFGFDPHLALNVQRILREEAHLGRVADPAGGSYYLEALTDALAREAWKLFQHIEEAGGWTTAVQSGLMERELSISREMKAKTLATRRRTMVGVNGYPNATDHLESSPPAGNRLAEPFEKIRLRTVRHGKAPKVLLLKRGDLKMRVARANFCLNFFGCAGFDMLESDQYADDADLIVLCSADAEYVALAREVCAAVKTPVLIAGNPKEQLSELVALGVQGFVHVQSDMVETLTHWQDRLGMEAL